MKNIANFDNFLQESVLQDNYREFFSKLLKLYGVKSPAQFKGKEDLAKKFYADIAKGWSKGNGLTKYGKKIMETEELEKVNEDVEFTGTDEEVEGAVKIDGGDVFSQRYKLKDGRIVEVIPSGKIYLVKESVNESKLQDNYRDFFSQLLKLYGIKSPLQFKNKKELSDKFYADVKKGWTGGKGLSEYGKKIMEVDSLEDLKK